MWFILAAIFGGLYIFYAPDAKASGFNTTFPIPDNLFNFDFSLPDLSIDYSEGGFNLTLDTSRTDVDTLARTAWGEGRGGGARSMQAVINCIMNRYEAARESVSAQQMFGETVEGICKKRAQFSCWNITGTAQEIANHEAMLAVDDTDASFRTALDLASQAINQGLQDITNGALYYRGYGANIPQNAQLLATIGGNKYFNYA